MKALYYDAVPVNVYSKKQRDPDRTTIMGAKVYSTEILPALLKYGTFDRYYLPEVGPDDKEDVHELPEIKANGERIRFLPEHQIPALRQPDTIVFMTPGNGLRYLGKLRAKAGRYDAPVTGVLHSLNYDTFAEELLLEMLSPLESFDAFFGSSVAGIEAFQRQLALVKRQYGKLSQPLEFKPKLINIPLGVNEADYGVRHTESVPSLRAQYGIAKDAIVMLYFGRLSSLSKADLFPLILVSAQMRSTENKLHLVIAGDDTQLRIATDLQEYARQFDCTEHVTVIPDPLSEDKRRLFCIADMFVSPSDCTQETFGITLIEAMAAALPVIASDWSGYRDIVDHGKTGFLIPSVLPDYPPEFDILHSSGGMMSDDLLARTTAIRLPELRDALRVLAANETVRKSMGSAGRRKVDEVYEWSKVIRAYEAAWDALVLDAAHEPPTDRGSYGIASYKEVFGHYATQHLRLTSVVELDLEYDDPGQLKVTMSAVAKPEDRFDPLVFKSILRQIREVSTVSVREIVEADHGAVAVVQGSTVDQRTLILAHTARLLKYGLIRLCLPDKVRENK